MNLEATPEITKVQKFDIRKNALCVVEGDKIEEIKQAVMHYALNSELELTVIHSIATYNNPRLVLEFKTLACSFENVFYHDIKVSPDRFGLSKDNPKLSLNFLDIFIEDNQELYCVGSEKFINDVLSYNYHQQQVEYRKELLMKL